MDIEKETLIKLHKITGCGMMSCKYAWKESNGDFDKAIEILKKRSVKLLNIKVV
ncbi:MAG: hypothetical protein MJZ34_04955 [Paludibacteraceae bacterium]|nr:hypothetical protein [Paludibacteraceae bacterium]